jgi:hypothetical protein
MRVLDEFLTRVETGAWRPAEPSVAAGITGTR